MNLYFHFLFKYLTLFGLKKEWSWGHFFLEIESGKIVKTLTMDGVIEFSP